MSGRYGEWEFVRFEGSGKRPIAVFHEPTSGREVQMDESSLRSRIANLKQLAHKYDRTSEENALFLFGRLAEEDKE